MINITSIDEVIGREPISAMRRFVEQQKNGTYSDFDLETLALVFSSFLTELDKNNLKGANKKRELGSLFVKYFQGDLKVGQQSLPQDVQQRVEIDTVLLYKTKYKTGGAKKLKEDIVELVFKTYGIPSFSIKTFEAWHTKWGRTVENLLNDELQKELHVREMNKRIIKNNAKLSDEEKEYYSNI